MRRQRTEGVARVIPVQPQPDPPPGEAAPVAPPPVLPRNKRQLLPFGFAITASAFRTIDAGDLPEYWYVSLTGTAGAELTIYENDRQAGEPLAIIGPRGYCKLPATSDRITLVAGAGATATGVCVAASGLDYHACYGSS